MLRLLIAASALALTVPLRAADYLIPARNTGKWGYIDASGTVVIPLRYTAASLFIDGRAEVHDGERVLVIGPDGGELAP